ncbi:MAG: hypothetical protein V4850_32290 [Myxococcota bacterium]
MLDTHGGGTRADSTAQLVIAHPELVYEHLLGAYLDRADNGEDLSGKEFAPVVLTHVAPDFDAVVATLFVQALIEDGELPWWAPALAAYAAEVDQGRYRPREVLARAGREPTPTDVAAALLSPVHAAFLAVQWLAMEEKRDHEWALTSGLALVRRVAEAVAKEKAGALTGSSFYAFQPGADAWKRDPGNAKLSTMLDEEPGRWKADFEDAEKLAIPLPATDGRSLQVSALLLARPPESRLNKYWARSFGFVYFVCPYGAGVDGSNPTYPKVVLSLDPLWDDAGAKPSLLGLGFALEREERKHREAQGRDERIPIPRYADGSCDNDDPWYDGRAHGHTIVDAPREGTRLPYSKVREIACSPFWEPPIHDVRITVVRRALGETLPPLSGSKLDTLRVGVHEVVTLTQTVVTLDALEKWLTVAIEAGHSPIRVAARHINPFWPVDSVLNRLARRFGAPHELDAQSVYLGSGVLWAVPREGQVSGSAAKEAAFAEVARLDIRLEEFALEMRRAVSKRPAKGARDRVIALRNLAMGTGRGLAQLRRDFLDFRVSKLDTADGGSSRWDPAAIALAERLRLRERAEHTKENLDELAGIEGQLNQKVFEGLAVLIGVAGVAQTVAAVFAMSAEQRTSPFWMMFWGLTLVPVLIAIGLIWRRDAGTGG